MTFIAPMLATLADAPFSRDGWYFEPKLDGIRGIAVKNGSRVELWTRNELDLTARFPDIVTALKVQRLKSFVADGEIVMFRGDVTSFEALQQRSGPAFFYLFDLLTLDGQDLRHLPLRERKARLERAIAFKDPLRYSEHTEGKGEALYEEACRKGWEGIIGKDAESPYVSKRSKAWLKFKCLEAQEFVIGGWTEPAGSRVAFGALLVGYYEGAELRFAGKVGTGFDTAMLRALGARLKTLEVTECPFRGGGLPRLRVHWAKPELVAQCAFHEWTAGGKLRQPRFLGLRDDKKAREVVREKKAHIVRRSS